MAFDIANSLRPADVAQNFLAGRQQAQDTQNVQFRNSLLQNQENRSQAEFTQQQNMLAQQQEQAQKMQVAKQTSAEADHILGATDEMIPQLLAQFPHIAQAAQQAGLDPNDVVAIRRTAAATKAKVDSILGQGADTGKVVFGKPGEQAYREQGGNLTPVGDPVPTKQEPPKPSDELSKLNSDLKAGLINQQDYNARRALLLRGPQSDMPSLQRFTRPTEDGKLQDFTYNPKTGETKPIDSPYQKQAELSPKDTQAAKNKLTAITLARTQLAQAREKFDALKDSWSVGLGGGMVRSVAGKNLDAAIDGMRQTITGLTRTPGIGSMSDFETRLNQAQLPNRNDYEETYGQKLDQIGSMLDVLESGYGDMLGGKSDTQRPAVTPKPDATAPAAPKKTVKFSDLP